MKKHEKYLKSKTEVKKLLRAFNEELWAIKGFLKSGQNSTHILRAAFGVQRMIYMYGREAIVFSDK